MSLKSVCNEFAITSRSTPLAIILRRKRAQLGLCHRLISFLRTKKKHVQCSHFASPVLDVSSQKSLVSLDCVDFSMLSFICSKFQRRFQEQTNHCLWRTFHTVLLVPWGVSQVQASQSILFASANLLCKIHYIDVMSAWIYTFGTPLRLF